MRRRRGPSAGEKCVVDTLKRLGYTVLHDEAGFFEGRPLLRPDVVVPVLNLVFEYDGEQHFRTAGRKYYRYRRNGGCDNDRYKDEACASAGIHLARIPFNTKLSDIPKLVLEAVSIAVENKCLLTASGSDYYDCPRALPRRTR